VPGRHPGPRRLLRLVAQAAICLVVLDVLVLVLALVLMLAAGRE
jgi:hypothetical protein